MGCTGRARHTEAVQAAMLAGCASAGAVFWEGTSRQNGGREKNEGRAARSGDLRDGYRE